MSATYKGRHVRLLAVQGDCATCQGTGKVRTTLRPTTGDKCLACSGLGGTATDLLHPTEPFFLIRGQDVLMPAIVYVYAALLMQATEGAVAFDHDLLDLADRVRDWQADNPHLTKLPD